MANYYLRKGEIENINTVYAELAEADGRYSEARKHWFQAARFANQMNDLKTYEKCLSHAQRCERHGEFLKRYGR